MTVVPVAVRASSSAQTIRLCGGGGVHFNITSPLVDIHEFTLVGNGTAAIITQYRTVPANLSAYGVPGIGYIYDSVFQEQRLSGGVVLFECRLSEHVGLDESKVAFFGGTA